MRLFHWYKIWPAETDNNNKQNDFLKHWTVFKGDSNGTPELHFWLQEALNYLDKLNQCWLLFPMPWINNLTARQARRVVPAFTLLCLSIAGNNICHLKSNGIISLIQSHVFFFILLRKITIIINAVQCIQFFRIIFDEIDDAFIWVN